MNRHSLLSDRLISARVEQWQAQMSLPEILATLGTASAIDFSALRPHQQQAWYCFLVQLAVIALYRAGESDPEQASDWWREGLLDLTGGEEASWCLYVEDTELPAFMQVPTPDLNDYTGTSSATPDGVDAALDARYHDTRPLIEPSPEHWVYALTALQTTGRFGGRRLYGVSRMNGGAGSRPMVGMAPGLAWPERWQRDVRVLLKSRDKIVDSHGFADKGIALLWCEPWDGKSSLPLEECDPYIIEICRRIRLVGEDLVARTAGSSMLRLNAKMRHGDLGDPWMPIHRNQGKALTIGSAGLHYKLVQDLLLGSEYAPGAALEMHDDDSWFIAHAIECGQAKTPALHDRFMLIPPRVRLLLQTDQGRERIAARAGQMVGDAAAMSKVLWAALLPLCRESDPKRRSPEISLHRRPYDRGIDQHFFPCLFQSIEGSESEAALDWQRLLHKLAQNVLMDAIQRTSVPEAKKWARVAEAEAAFGRGVHKRFPDLQSVPDSIESLEPEHGTETDFALER